jgi:RimJ/RimL family protein N-acetyltransferase
VTSDSSPQDPSNQTPLGPAYRIVTPRLCIRCWSPTDAPLLKAAIDTNVEYLRPWAPWASGETLSVEARVSQIRGWRAKFDLDEDYVYGVFDLQETEVIGGTGLHTRQGSRAREIGYWIQEKHQHQGIATEIAACLTRVAFEVDRVDRVHIHCILSNSRSARIPERLGFVYEGTLRKRLPNSKGEIEDMKIWTLLREEYPGSIPSKSDVRAFDAAGKRIL